ncbi:MAG TPA: gliding motility-associated C-terminal domain-containing protein [Saprospiraceae bacterium]|nr:gliding motility-associated C-terminal domain-containing protein [Saprospiraceae bacterium]
MKNFLLTLFLLPTLLTAQDQYIKTYDHYFTDRANAIEVLPSGRMVLVGATALQNSSQQTMMVLMVEEDGQIAWTRTYTAEAPRSEALDVFRANDGNLIITYDAFNSAGEAKASWMKIKPSDGSVVWNKRALPSCRLLRISPLQDGYLLTGDYVISPTDRDALAVKINESGDMVWFNIFGEPGYEQLGEGWQDAQGLIHCAGYHIETNESQGIYAKFNAAGDLVGSIQRYSIGDNTDLLSHIAPLANGGFMFAGNSQGFTDGNARAWTLTTDEAGNAKTSFTYGIPGKQIGVTDLIGLPGDQFVLSLGRPGNSGTPATLIKINANNDMLWQNTYKGDGANNMLWQVESYDDGFVSAGVSGAGTQTNMLLARTDRNGKSGDCCPVAAGLKRESVSPVQSTMVPNETTVFLTENVVSTVSEESSLMQTVCQPIEVDFQIADSTLCPGECTQIIFLSNAAGVEYTITIVGADPDPNIPGRICHTEGGQIIVTRTGAFNGCQNELSKTVEIGAKEDVFPNAFTPNGDGVNDVFRPIYPCEVVASKLQVYSRWGEKVFETNNPNQGWDGKYNNLDAPSDVYIWRVEYEAIRAGQQSTFTQSGDVTLLR